MLRGIVHVLQRQFSSIRPSQRAQSCTYASSVSVQVEQLCNMCVALRCHIAANMGPWRRSGVPSCSHCGPCDLRGIKWLRTCEWRAPCHASTVMHQHTDMSCSYKAGNRAFNAHRTYMDTKTFRKELKGLTDAAQNSGHELHQGHERHRTCELRQAHGELRHGM